MKVTMKVDEATHQKLRMVQALIGAKTLGEAIKVLSEERIELHLNKKKGK